MAQNSEAVEWYVNNNFSVIPIRAINKKPYLKTWKQYQTERANTEQVTQWWSRWPNAMIGIVTGKISNIIVIDVDSKAGHDALSEFLPDTLVTPVARTPSGGWHYYFRYREGLSNGVRVLSDCDVRTDGGYVIAPPSVNSSGKAYAWL